MADFSIVIPAHNEEAVISETVRAIRGQLREDRVFGEIIVVDDGSQDRTAEIASEAIGGEGRVIRLNPNRGKAGAIAEGVNAATADRVLFTDADLSVPPEFFKPMIRRLDQAEVVIGSRHVQGAVLLRRQAWLRETCGEGFRLLVRRFFMREITDFTCGLKAFKTEAAKKLFDHLTCTDWTFDVEVLLRARRMGYRIDQIPVTWSNRPDSRVRLLSAIFRSAKSLLRLWEIYGDRKS